MRDETGSVSATPERARTAIVTQSCYTLFCGAMTDSGPYTSSGQPTRSVLIVDDNPINRQMMVDFVDLLGHKTIEAASGEQALEIMAPAPPDAVLMDYHMGGMSGGDVLKAMGQDEQLRHVPVILISARSDLETVTEVLEAGAVDFMSKPFNPTILKSRLASSFERKDMRDREQRLLAELKRSYADLKKAEEGRDALTHMIVHDLGNPLSVIKMNAEVLQMSSSMGTTMGPAAISDRVSYVVSASETMDTMIRSMLDISKMEAGQLEPNLQAVQLENLFAGIVQRFAPLASDAGLALDFSAAPDVSVEADPVLLERILSNLMTNAFKYATGASFVRLEALRRDSGVKETGIEVCVVDDGLGIPEDIQSRIFDKFYQVSSSENGGQRVGVGLGLAFCRMASEAMGGSIRVESNASKGSRFILELSSS